MRGRLRCGAYAVTAGLQGTQDFKIADAAWPPSASFAAPRDSAGDGGTIPVDLAARQTLAAVSQMQQSNKRASV